MMEDYKHDNKDQKISAKDVLYSEVHHLSKLLLIMVMLICFISSCTDSYQAPLASSHDYCELLSTDKSKSEFLLLDTIPDNDQTGVYVLESGQSAITARANMCQLATESMDIQYFIFSEDNIGTLSCDYMLRAACKGVKVRVIVDDLMIDTDYNWILAINQHENIDIKIYNPNINLGKNLSKKLQGVVTDFRGINQRMHHKTFIVDQKIAITGGRNIADEYFDFDHKYNFRDRDVLLVGGEVNQIQSSFDEYWKSEYSIPIDQLIGYSKNDYDPAGVYQYIHEYALDSTNFWPEIRTVIPMTISTLLASDEYQKVNSVRFISDPPGKNTGEHGLTGGSNTSYELIQLLLSAKKEIYIQSPYLIVSDAGYQIFKMVAERGVDIHILTNSLSSTDNLEAFSGYQRNRERLLEAGIHLYEYRPDAQIRKALMQGSLQKRMDYVPIFGLHAKSMVVDDSISVVGTFNLDPRSANLNTECVTIIYDQHINTLIKDIMIIENESENAWTVTKDFNSDAQAGRWKRFKAWTRRIVPVSVL